MFFHALVLAELSEALLLVGRLDEASTWPRSPRLRSHTQRDAAIQAHAYRLLGEIAAQRASPQRSS